jgi:hypothetical protein
MAFEVRAGKFESGEEGLDRGRGSAILRDAHDEKAIGRTDSG